MEIKYKNPLKKGLMPFDHGDPFIYRFNGQYYLFTTGADLDCPGHLYKTNDLVNYQYLGTISEDKILNSAFAPEIIYAYNRFYLCTSPKGRGHYICVSDNIEGPYKVITGNIEHLIDGSFTLDKNNRLHFLHASINGISMCDIDEEGNVTNEKNIIDDLDGWTEGPSIVQRDGLYYLFYCGNHYLAKGYRIHYAVSEKLEGPYIKGVNNPLLINTDGQLSRIGHSSEVLSPDLINTQLIYHSKKNLTSKRDVLMDCIKFDKKFVSVTNTDFLHSDYSLPVFESIDGNNLIKTEDFLLSKNKTTSDFSIEAHINKETLLVFNYLDNNNYCYLQVNNETFEFGQYENKDKTLIASFKNAFDFSKIHNIRITKETEYSFYVDNVYIGRFVLKDNIGRVGYRIKEDSLFGYLAFNLLATTKDIIYLPTTTSIKKYNVDNYYQIQYAQKNKSKVFISLSGSISKNTVISINGIEFKLNETGTRFKKTFFPVGELVLEKEGTINIKIIEGKAKLNLIKIQNIKTYKEINTFKKKEGYYYPKKKEDSYYLSTDELSFPDVNLSFVISEIRPYESFGVLLNVADYSNEKFQCRYHFNGILIKIEGDFLSIQDVKYHQNVLIDRKVNITTNELHHLTVSYQDYSLIVKIDNSEVAHTLINSINTFGRFGMYCSPLAKVKMKMEGIKNE